jgi:dipeptidyl aminopeptidase/acylaminoacyl peptidase
MCTAAFAQSDPQASAIPLDHFTRHDEFGTIKISPDGRSLALTAGKYGRSELATFDLEKMAPLSGARAPEWKEIDEFHWVSANRLIYLIAERQLGLVVPVPTGEIFGINRDGGRHGIIYGYRAGQTQTGTWIKGREASYAAPVLVSALRNDDDKVLIAEFPWRVGTTSAEYDRDARPNLIRLDVYSGEKRSLGVAPLVGASLLVDRDDHVRFASGLDRNFELAVSWKPEPDAEWTDFELPGFRDESIQPQRFSSDNHSVYFTGVREGERYAALYRLDLQTRNVEKLLAFDDCDVMEVISDFADVEIVGVKGYTHRPVYHWLKPGDPAAKVYQSLQRAFSGQDVTITSASEDGRLAIAFVDSDVNPGEYYLFDTKALKADFIRAARAWIDPRQMRPKSPIQLTARDGLTLHGYLTRPAGEGPYPMVVLPHGGPHFIRDLWTFDSEVQLLASRGYAVLQVDFRGSGGYGMDFEAAGYKEWGAKMQDDITDATRWAIQQKVAIPERICLFGSSYGGYAALMGVAREPDLYRCAVGYAGVYDLELTRESGNIPQSRSGRAYLAKALGDDPADLRARSPVNHIQKIRAPVLLVHGKEDWQADYKQATEMKKALEQNGKQFEWMALRGEGHGVYDEASRRQVYERILSFLDQHLKPATTDAVAGQVDEE